MKFKEGKSALLGLPQSVVVDLKFELRYDSKSNVLSTTAAILELGIECVLKQSDLSSNTKKFKF